MLSKNEIFSIYADWESDYLPSLAQELGVKTERQKQALFRVFDSFIWSTREQGSLLPRIETANAALEAADIPQVERALSAVVGVVVTSLEGRLGAGQVPAALLATASGPSFLNA